MRLNKKNKSIIGLIIAVLIILLISGTQITNIINGLKTNFNSVASGHGNGVNKTLSITLNDESKVTKSVELNESIIQTKNGSFELKDSNGNTVDGTAIVARCCNLSWKKIWINR